LQIAEASAPVDAMGAETGGQIIGVIASGKLEKGERDSNSETFHATLRVNESRPAKLGQQPEASLAWWRATFTAKRRQRVPMPCDRAPKSSARGSHRCCHKRRPCRGAAMAWRTSVLPGSKNRAQGHEGRSGT